MDAPRKESRDAFFEDFDNLFRHEIRVDLISWVREIRSTKLKFLAAQKIAAGDDGPIYLQNIENPDYEILITRKFIRKGWKLTTYYKKAPTECVCFEDRNVALESAIGMSTKEGAPVGSVWFRVKNRGKDG